MSNEETDLFQGLGIEVKLAAPEDFLKVKETLTRIGVASKKDNTLTQSCHILHKRGRYSILHFKELFLLDGKKDKTVFTDSDRARRTKITELLDEWGLVEIIDLKKIEADPEITMAQIKVVPYAEKGNWSLVAKYNIGTRKAPEAVN
ncbi:MAG TPA: translational repressor RegA [bacterium]